MIKLFIRVLLYLILFLIGISLKKSVIKVVSKELFMLSCCLDRYSVNKVISKELFMLNYCLDRYKTQEMCDKAIDSCLPALKLVPDWFVTNKMLKKFVNGVFFNDDKDLHKIECDIITFFSDGMNFVTIDLNNNKLDDENFDEDDLANIILAKVIAWHNRFKRCKASKKDTRDINACSLAYNKRSVELVYDKILKD